MRSEGKRNCLTHTAIAVSWCSNWKQKRRTCGKQSSKKTKQGIDKGFLVVFNRGMENNTVLEVGQIVCVFGFMFRVLKTQGSCIAPDGQRTYYFDGEVTDHRGNDSIRNTCYARGYYSYRPKT